MKTKVQIEKWVRKDAFRFFSDYEMPYAQAAAYIHFNKIPLFAKKQKLSFYGIIAFLVLKALNRIESFHYGMEEKTIYYYSDLSASFTTLDSDYQVCFSPPIALCEFEAFMKDFQTKKINAELHQSVQESNDYNGITYFSCLPRLEFTGILQPMRLAAPDAVPRVTWGKYEKVREGYKMIVNLQVHHGFQDGKDIEDFFLLLQKETNEFECEFCK